MNKYPHQLSKGHNNAVVALSKTEAGKIFTPESRVEISVEVENMKFANSINNLVCKFIRVDIDEPNQILVMERLEVLDFRTFEIEIRETMFKHLEDKIKELHESGFVHRDIERPSGFNGEPYDNIILTKDGFRLIDVGISALKSRTGDILFESYRRAEIEELKGFSEYLLNR